MNQSFETTQKPITPSVTQSPNVPVSSNEMSIFSGKNLVITILTTLLILSFLGINLLSSIDNIFQTLTNVFGPLFTQILSVFGYTAGTVIDKSTDVVTDVAKTGIDIAGDTIQSAADLLKDASRKHVNTDAVQQLDKSINSSNGSSGLIKLNEPEPDNSVDPIQKPITSNKTNWCLVGEYEGRRGCVEVNSDSQCMSGQTFPTQAMCLNPARGGRILHSHA